MLLEQVKNTVQAFSGLVGVYYKNLVTGESLGIHEDHSFVAASVIKVPIMVEVFRQIAHGTITLDTLLPVREEDKVPSCGVLRMMHKGLTVTVQDLCYLMIVISDNTATNILIQTLGMDRINTSFQKMGLQKTRVNRLLFDVEARQRGLQNYFSPLEIGTMLEGMWSETLISPEASRQMIDMMLNQQLNHKIPYFLRGVNIAHKTGEDDGVTHDVGIVYAAQPFILCLASNDTDVVETEMGFREIARICFEHSNQSMGE